MRCETCGNDYDPELSDGCPNCAVAKKSRKPGCGFVLLAATPLLILLIFFILVILRAASSGIYAGH